MQTLFSAVKAPDGLIAGNRRPRTFTLVAPLCGFAFLVGTAGGYSAANLGSAIDCLGHPDLIPAASVPTFELPSSSDLIAAALLDIRETFGLTMSELALILGVSRAGLYAWLRGARPKDQFLSAIWTLQSAAKELAGFNLRIPRSYLRRPLVEGRSLLELLTARTNLTLGIKALAAALIPANRLVALNASGSVRLRRRVNTVDDISPLVNE